MTTGDLLTIAGISIEDVATMSEKFWTFYLDGESRVHDSIVPGLLTHHRRLRARHCGDNRRLDPLEPLHGHNRPTRRKAASLAATSPAVSRVPTMRRVHAYRGWPRP